MDLKPQNSSKNAVRHGPLNLSLPLAYLAITALLLLSLFSVPGCTVQYSITLSQDDLSAYAISDALESVVSVRTEHGSGTGILLSEYHVLTAAHVVYDENDPDFTPLGSTGSVIQERPDGVRAADFIVVAINLQTDLALLGLKTEEGGIPAFYGLKCASLLSQEEDPLLIVGRKLFVIGHPLGVPEPHITEGRVTDLDDHGYLRFSSFSYFGNSGGPGLIIGLDGDLKVVAVVQLLIVDSRGLPVGNLALGANPNTIRDFLHTNGYSNFVQ